MYGMNDARVAGMILLNPWVHSERAEAQVRLKSYYLSRLRGREFWDKLMHQELDVLDSIKTLIGYLRTIFEFRSRWSEHKVYVDGMLRSAERFEGCAFVGLSGNDFTADEFREVLKYDHAKSGRSVEWIDEIVLFDGANHTFAQADWRGEVETQTMRWLSAVEQTVIGVG